jgi:osmotically inducible protein OsmC
MTPLYTAIVTAHGGRDGKIHADEPALDLALATPKSLGGPGGAATNPEQLFAAGYAACFESALRMVARLQKQPVDDAHITAHVTLNKTDAGGYGLSVELHGKIAGRTPDEAKALLEAAHQVCPYSVATRGNIDVKLVVES